MNGPHVYSRKEWIERLFESGFTCLRVGFHEDQKYFRSGSIRSLMSWSPTYRA
ncbi:unnamed protein product [Arabidopsis thaliana]|nr:unnamed protein product [Arabidopsis thaliana]